MKQGREYVASREKQVFDVVFAYLLMPGKKAGELAIQKLIQWGDYPDLSPILEQERVGRGQRLFTIQKFQTLYPGTEEPLDAWAATLRRLGLDELAQIANIRAGDMSFTGPRPLIVEEYEETRDNLPPKLGQQWDDVMAVSRPGLYSSFGIYSHSCSPEDDNGPVVRAEMDVKDFVDASVHHDIELTARFAGVAIGHRLK